MSRGGQALVELLPDLAADIERSMMEQRRDELANQVGALMIASRCCDDAFCSSFYTGPRPEGEWEVRPETVVVTASREGAMVAVDVVDGAVRYVEVVDWPEVGRALDEAGLRAPDPR